MRFVSTISIFLLFFGQLIAQNDTNTQAEQLREYQKMLAEGLIDSSDYNELKRELLFGKKEEKPPNTTTEPQIMVLKKDYDVENMLRSGKALKTAGSVLLFSGGISLLAGAMFAYYGNQPYIGTVFMGVSPALLIPGMVLTPIGTHKYHKALDLKAKEETSLHIGVGNGIGLVLRF